jgi:putative Holliday junction resolvase
MPNNLIALDIGHKRIGVARANTIAKLAIPVATLANNSSFLKELSDIISEFGGDVIVVGLPRSLNGNETDQSRYTRQFVADNLASYKIIWQDETLSTEQAKQLNGPHGIDADAACIILEDYLKVNYEL